MSNVAIIKEPRITAGVMLAASLRRERRFDEARAVLADELGALDPEDAAGRLSVACESARVEMCDGRPALAVRLLLEASPLAELSEDLERVAKFRHTLAAAYQLAGETDAALIEYAGAAAAWASAENYLDAGCTENNVALIQILAGRFEEARYHIGRARAFFVDMPVKSAEVDDTEAQLLLAEGEPFEALRLVNRAVEVFYAHSETELIKKSLPVLLKAAADYQLEAAGKPPDDPLTPLR